MDRRGGRDVRSEIEQVEAGRCNAMIKDLIAEIPPYGLNVALLDPFRANDLQFTTIAKLATVKRMDLIIHYRTMDLKRNVGRDRRTANAFIGSDLADGIASPSEVARGIETLKSNLVSYGYTGKQVRSIAIKNTKGNIIYHLVFASKTTLKVKSGLKGGKLAANHSRTGQLKVATQLKAGKLSANHSRTLL
jgi:three-Cys-motif partner protein